MPLRTGYDHVAKSRWTGPADIKSAFGSSVDFIGDNRIIFDIGGNKHPLIIRVSYTRRAGLSSSAPTASTIPSIRSSSRSDDAGHRGYDAARKAGWECQAHPHACGSSLGTCESRSLLRA
ncbi:type II toxin-antitoxin system HigB family toxin [Methylobacterium sp. J-088]|uniref:type II toxin-antitoxin system HigB family toxin n=1 Tax=unclassified Methylobacterium TaxID=2615210 RepID=UPI001FBB25E6|nr:type II toxin-antitoxin system HigB family toxin [Methylobacterium sp. J-088]MCJ2062643.1 type II toxin-antitoxin system HigB family toxin [Methylobacterium sp. J-088]